MLTCFGTAHLCTFAIFKNSLSLKCVAMKYFFLLLFSFFFTLARTQSINNLFFGTDSTFDVATWNIEHFPKNGQTTIDSVTAIIYALDLDYIAMQEVDNPAQFENFIDQLEGYEGFYQQNVYARLGVIYKSDLVVNDLYQIFTTNQYDLAFSRPPIVMEVEFMGAEYVLINNHFKCCGDGYLDTNDLYDEENRRRAASIFLKDYIDTNFPNSNVMVFGDLNDILTDSEANNVFQNFLDDSENYRFADMDIATSASTNWSYPSWPSHLDHILVTDELFDELGNSDSEVACLKIDLVFPSGWNYYDSNISDHRPVAMRFTPNIYVGSENAVAQSYYFRSYPNPMVNATSFQFDALQTKGLIRIFNSLGQEVALVSVDAGQKNVSWHTTVLSSGIYIAQLIDESGVRAVSKLVVE